jgi:hypothetical protein
LKFLASKAKPLQDTLMAAREYRGQQSKLAAK